MVHLYQWWSGCRMGLYSILASGPGKFHLEEARGLASKIFLNRRYHWEECSNLFKCLPGKEGEATWLVGRRRDVCQCKVSLTLTVKALQGWPQLLLQSFLLVPHAVLTGVPCILCHTRTCGTPFPPCSSVIVSIRPVTQQLIALSMPLNEEAAGAGADELFSTKVLLRIRVQRERKGKEAGLPLVESCPQCWGMGKSSNSSCASTAVSLASIGGVLMSIWLCYQGVVFGWWHWDDWKGMASLKSLLPLNVIHGILGVPEPEIWGDLLRLHMVDCSCWMVHCTCHLGWQN